MNAYQKGPKIIMGDFNAKIGKEKIFKPTIGQESLHQNQKSTISFPMQTSQILIIIKFKKC